MNKLEERTSIVPEHIDWLREHLFTGPRWLTAPPGYNWKKGMEPIEVTYQLSWSGPTSTVWAEVEIDEIGELQGSGRNSQDAHNRLVKIMNTSGLNRALLPWHNE